MYLKLQASFACAAAKVHNADMRRFAQFACIDWSGAVTERPAGIAVAETTGASGVSLLRPAQRWSRQEVFAYLEDIAQSKRDILIGLDLSPTFPFLDHGAYFPGLRESPKGPRALWEMVDTIAADDPFLTANSFVDHPQLAPYFRRHGGREGAQFGGGTGRLRAVEMHQRTTQQARSASCFNLVGAAQVGKASLSAMRILHRLDGAIPFWPFDPVPQQGPLLVEIYTSVATRAAGIAGNRSKIRDHATLDTALATLGAATAPLTRIDDHITDAMVTAAWLRRASNNPALWSPAAMTPQVAAQEGWTFGIL
jgi:hypothetical protein